MRALVAATREHSSIRLGASPRGALSLFEACQAYAMVECRDYVTPGDVKKMAVPVLSHRLLLTSQGGNRLSTSRERGQVIDEILGQLSVPV